jgi:mercuric ion transport protein
MKPFLDKLGGIGAVVAAAACPVCFPKLALIGALFGLGAFGAYEAQLFIAAQALVVVSMIGHGLSYLRHRNRWLLGGALASGAAVFAGLYWIGSEWLAYAGLLGLVAASVPQLWGRIRPRSKLEIFRL